MGVQLQKSVSAGNDFFSMIFGALVKIPNQTFNEMKNCETKKLSGGYLQKKVALPGIEPGS